jgi:sulfate/thiosulfate transport system ATP-binding protein
VSIHAVNIRKTFGRFVALENLELKVPSGRLVALLGPSGSGKTTLLRVLAGLEYADPGSNGRVFLHGVDVTDTPPGERGVGFVFQHYALFRHLTIFENIAFGLKIRGRATRPPKKELEERVHKLLDLVQLPGIAHRRPHQLSGGQRQRVALARALATEPKVLLLDEPFGALDAKVRKELRRWLRKFHESVQLTTVFVTHDQEEALELADEVVVMNNARIEQVGAPQEVYDNPATPFVFEFLGDVNRLELTTVPGAPPEATPAQGAVTYIRPHDIELLLEKADDTIPVVAHHVFAAGSWARVQVVGNKTGEWFDVEMTRYDLDRLKPAHGKLFHARLRRPRIFTKAVVPQSATPNV